MRELRFIVDRLKLKKDLDCDFRNIVAGSVGYLRAVFETTSEWSGCAMVARFSGDGKEDFAPVVDGKCVIPSSVLGGRSFMVQLLGTRGDDYRIASTEVIVLQKEA